MVALWAVIATLISDKTMAIDKKMRTFALY